MNVSMLKRLIGRKVWVNFIVDPAPPENYFTIMDIDDDGDWVRLIPIHNDKVEELVIRVADIDYMIVRNTPPQ